MGRRRLLWEKRALQGDVERMIPRYNVQGLGISGTGIDGSTLTPGKGTSTICTRAMSPEMVQKVTRWAAEAGKKKR